MTGRSPVGEPLPMPEMHNLRRRLDVRVQPARIAALAVAGRFGLLNPLRVAFGLQEIRATDLFIVSYPRSGNTWVRFIMAYLSQGTDFPIDHRSLKARVPELYHNIDTINATPGERLFKLHEPFLEACSRVIYVHRDYRQALVSYWLFCRRLGAFTGTFSDFLRSPHPAMHGSWKASLGACQRRQQSRPESIFVMGYQELLDDFTGTVRRLVDWAGIGTGVDLEQLRERTARAALAQGEREGGSAFLAQSGNHFFADGGAGRNWRTYWSDADLAWLARDRALMALMEEFGYR